MQLKKTMIALSLCSAFALGGCATAPAEMTDKDGNVLTEEQIAKMDRDEYTSFVMTEMEKVGFEIISISPVMDKVSISINEVFERQYKVLDEYRTIADSHRDVQSFLYANHGKSKEELQAAIIEFDGSAEKEEDKIGPRITAYNEANDKIFAANVELAIQIGLQAAELGLMVANNADQLLGVEGISLLLGADKIGSVYSAAETRIDLAQRANAMIEQDQAVVQIAAELQTLQL